MTTVGEICRWMNDLAPLQLSEPWDNTGLLLGDPSSDVSRIQTCLTLTSDSVQEAIDQRADLVIAHHPLPFKPLSRITTQSTPGQLLWRLARSSIAVYSPHTAWDSAAGGINALLADKLGLRTCVPLIPSTVAGLQQFGAGRIGDLESPASLDEIALRLCRLIPDCRLRAVISCRPIKRIAIACGSGGSLLDAAVKSKCDLFLTGEATFHTCLEAQAAQIAMLLVGHFASERFSLVELADKLSAAFPNVESWSSQRERDPVQELTIPLPQP